MPNKKLKSNSKQLAYIRHIIYTGLAACIISGSIFGIIYLLGKCYTGFMTAINYYRWQEVYFHLTRAYSLSSIEYGKLEAKMTSEEVLYRLTRNMRIKRVCNNAVKEGCWPEKSLLIDESPEIWDANTQGYELYNGVLVSHIQSTYSSCDKKGICVALSFDINGKKKPNTYGKDEFRIYYYQDKVVPYNPTEDGLVGRGVKNYLNIK